jgi:DNA-binding response OmpR family regulator
MSSYGYVTKSELKKKIKDRTGVHFKDNALRTAVNRLRAKLYKFFNMRLIKTRYGIGYYIGPERKKHEKG